MSSQQEELEGKSKKSKKEDEYDKSATVKKSKKEKNTEKESKKQSRKEKKAQEPSSNNEDPTSRKQKNHTGGLTGGSGGAELTGGSTGPKDKTFTGTGGEGTSKKSKKEKKEKKEKKKEPEHQTESARLGAKADELLRHARTPMEDTKDDLTNRIMALSPSTTLGKDSTDNRFITEEEKEDVDRSETVKKNKKDNDPEKLPPEKKKPKDGEKKKVASTSKSKTTASGSKSISMEKGRSAEGKTKTGSKEGARSTTGGGGRVRIVRKHVYKSCIDHKILKRLDKLPRQTRIAVWTACAITFFLGTAVCIYILYDALGKVPSASPSPPPPTAAEENQD